MEPYSRNMPNITKRKVVTANECETILRAAGWQERTIELLARGTFPKEVQVGPTLLIVR